MNPCIFITFYVLVIMEAGENLCGTQLSAVTASVCISPPCFHYFPIYFSSQMTVEMNKTAL